MKEFLKRKNIEISLKRYGIDALSAMAQGLFCSLLIGTIINTFGAQLHIGFLTETVAKLVEVPTREENDFMPDPDDIKAAITDKTKVIILNSPSNPTGAVMRRGELAELK